MKLEYADGGKLVKGEQDYDGIPVKSERGEILPGELYGAFGNKTFTVSLPLKTNDKIERVISAFKLSPHIYPEQFHMRGERVWLNIVYEEGNPANQFALPSYIVEKNRQFILSIKDYIEGV